MSILNLARLLPLWRRAAKLASTLSLVSFLPACSDSDPGRPTNPERTPVASIRIAPLDGALLVGSEHPIDAVPLSATGTVLLDRPLTWASDNAVVASVSAGGVVTARSAGRAGITASSEGKMSRVEVEVTAPRPAPALTAISPEFVFAGTEGPLVVDLRGEGFTTETRIRLDGIEHATEWIDVSTLRMSLSTAALAHAVTWSVTVSTPPPGGGISNALALVVQDVLPPTISALEPYRITAGWGGAFTLTIRGTGFTPRSLVSWDGAPRATRFLDAATLQVTIEPQDVRVARSVSVVVETPAPGGGSAASTFAVNAVPVARVTVQSPWGFAWTWRNHRLPLTAVAEDARGRELTDRQATWQVLDPFVATTVPLGDRDVAVYGSIAGETEVEATIDDVRARRTVRVHETPHDALVYEAGDGDDRHLMRWDIAAAGAPRRLATTMVAFAPSPSPDGSEVAFAGVEKGAGPPGNVDLYILGRDGRTRPISPSPAFDGDPAWSPDGTRLAFTSSRANGALDVFVVELASGALTRLTAADHLGSAAGSGFAARSPAWSPDGTSIAYTVQGTTGSQLWLMAADGQDKRQLTAGDVTDDFDPQWSPDGTFIAFTRQFRQPQPAVVMSVAPDGSQLSPIGGRVVNVAATPAFSPDGRWLTTSQARGSGAGAIHAFSIASNAGPRIVLPESLGGGRHARWARRP